MEILNMNTKILKGTFYTTEKVYRSKNGSYYFTFQFINKGLLPQNSVVVDVTCFG